MSLDKYVQSCNYYHNQDFSVSILNYTVYLQVIFFHFTVWYPSLYTMLMVVIHFGLIYDINPYYYYSVLSTQYYYFLFSQCLLEQFKRKKYYIYTHLSYFWYHLFG